MERPYGSTCWGTNEESSQSVYRHISLDIVSVCRYNKDGDNYEYQ